MEPDTQSERWFDEAELALMHLAETFKPKPYVSPRLERMAQSTRTEAEVRAARMPQAEGLLQCIARQSGLDRAFAKIAGEK